MSSHLKVLWKFFASVKLALMSIIVLAVVSIVGTLIQQKKAPGYYVEEYGSTLAGVFQALEITDMYSSWWFFALLSLFAVNLIVCSIERFPASWRWLKQDFAPPAEQLEKMSSKHRVETGLQPGVAVDRMEKIMTGSGWKKSRRLERGESTVLFAQQGAWTRFGAHVVHLSILVIFAGAMIGTLSGFKAYLFLPEGRSTDHVFLQGNREPLPLDFELYYDRFDIHHYPDGSVRELRADLTVYDPERDEPYEKTTVVNDPLQHRGISFYIADKYPLEEYLVHVQNRTTGQEHAFRVPPDRQVDWPQMGISFALDEITRAQDGAAQRVKLRFSHGTGVPSDLWMANKSAASVTGTGEEFNISVRQLYSTLFLVNKDPGVWVVYLGCALMVLGLCICFFFSHQRLWIQVAATSHGSQILIAGTANKHLPAFERRFQGFITRLQSDEQIVLTLPKTSKKLKKQRMAA